MTPSTRRFELLFLVFILISLSISGCESQSADITSTAINTIEPTTTPTLIPTPTNTPAPSSQDQVAEGNEFFAHSDIDSAIEAYNVALEIDDSYAPAYIGLSQVYYWDGFSGEESLSTAEKAVELAPESGMAYAALAQAQIGDYQYPEAQEAAEKAVELEPENAYIQAILAEAYIHVNEFDLAKNAVEKAYSLDSSLAETNIALGNYYFSTADFSRAMAAYKNAINIEPEFFGWKIMLGNYFFYREDYMDAMDAYDGVLDLIPNHPRTLINLASVSISMKDFEAADTYIDKAREQNPEILGVDIATGYFYLAQEEFDQAMDQFNRALEKDPEDYEAQEALANAYIRQDECEQASTHFQELNTAYPTVSDFRTGRGYAELCAGDYTKALSHFREAAKMNPYDGNAYIGLGAGYTYQERWDDAKDAYLEALHLSPAASLVHSEIGVWYWSQGLLEQANAELKLSLEQDPYYQPVYLFLVDLLLQENNDEEALQMAKDAVDVYPEDTEALRYLGIANYFLGELDEVEDALQQVLEKDPDDAYSHLYLGLTYRDQEKYSAAKAEIETYTRLMQPYLTEEEISLLTILSEALDLGYTVSENKAIEDFEYLFEYIGVDGKVHIEDNEDGRTMVVDFPGSAADFDSEEYYVYFGTITYFGSIYCPRIVPEVSNGVEIHFTNYGETVLTAKIPLEILQDHADTLIPSDSFTAYIEFTTADQPSTPASLSTIKRNVTELRSLTASTPVQQVTLTQDELQDDLVDGIDQEVRDSLKREQSVLSLLGVISPTLDIEDVWVDLYSGQVLGFYEIGENTLYAVEQESPSINDEVTIAHEYTHALQDQNFGLDTTDLDLNDDEELAFTALVEGDATYVSVLYTYDYISTLDKLDAASQVSGVDEDVIDVVPLFISELSIFPYLSGMEFVDALYQRGGWEAVNRAYEVPPQSSEQILHPERYWEWDEPINVPLLNYAVMIDGDWEEIDRNVFGELSLQLSLLEHVGPAAASSAADGWGGDAYSLLSDGSGESEILVIQTQWDETKESNQFWQLYQVAMGDRNEYTEIVDEVIGDVDYRWWQSDANYVYAEQDLDTVYIIIGADKAAIQQIIEKLN